MKIENDFSGIAKLRELLLENNNQLRIVHPHKIWTASFAWAEPASLKLVNELERSLELELPEDFKSFLTTISDGATLYYDTRYGQWGYKIYGVSDINLNRIRWQSIFEKDWAPHFLAVGEIIDESHPLVMNLNKPTGDNRSSEIVDANPLDPPSDWDKISRSFHEWLDNLITAQGAKYWLWK